jgi:peptidyl-prolyl cis-trans isomerase SurA
MNDHARAQGLFMHKYTMAAALVLALGIPASTSAQAVAASGQAAVSAPPANAQAPVPASVPKPEPKIEILEQILVKVNGEILTKTDLEGRQVVALRQRGPQMADDELKKAIAEVTPELLVDAVDEILMLQRGKELGYKVTDEQFKRVLENIRKENKLDDDAQFLAALKQEGLDLAALRKNIERSMIINQVQQVEVTGRLNVTEDEAVAYYGAHKDEFTTPSQITLRELMVQVKTDGKTVNVGLDEAAKAKTEAALARARKGESFEALVTELSDSPSKASGGLVGPLNEDELTPDIRKLIAGLQPGQVTNVFRTTAGWGFLKLETATKTEIKTLEQAREEISNKVFEAKRREEYVRYIQKLRAQAIIDWKNEEMHKLFNVRVAGPVAPKSGR